MNFLGEYTDLFPEGLENSLFPEGPDLDPSPTRKYTVARKYTVLFLCQRSRWTNKIKGKARREATLTINL